MKKLIKLTALFLLLSTVLFGAVPAKKTSKNPASSASKDRITVYTLPSKAGVDVIVRKQMPGKVIVTIFDEYANVELKQVVPAHKVMDKKYLLFKLDDGNYTIEVTSNKQVVRKDIQVNNRQCHLM
jgi:hypothetical protein